MPFSVFWYQGGGPALLFLWRPDSAILSDLAVLEKTGKRERTQSDAASQNASPITRAALEALSESERWCQLDSFPGIYCVWYSRWFPHSESKSSFLLALQSCTPPASSAMFPVTVTTFCRGLEDKLCKYLTQLLTQIGAQGFEKLSPSSLLAQ
jgi:hypothetical protein